MYNIWGKSKRYRYLSPDGDLLITIILFNVVSGEANVTLITRPPALLVSAKPFRGCCDQTPTQSLHTTYHLAHNRLKVLVD